MILKLMAFRPIPVTCPARKAEPENYCQARKKNPNPNFLVRIFSSGVGVFHMNGWGPKSSIRPSKPGKSNFLGGISRDFAGISRGCPKSLRKKVCVQFPFPILETIVPDRALPAIKSEMQGAASPCPTVPEKRDSSKMLCPKVAIALACYRIGFGPPAQNRKNIGFGLPRPSPGK